MITCKEDLMNTWIKNDLGELRDLYSSVCNKFGIAKFRGCKLDLKVIAAYSCGGGVNDLCELIDMDEDEQRGEMTELTMKDLAKPTRFVKVEESIFDLKEEFEKGELYEKGSGYTKLISESDFAFAYRENAIYRQVEIDWRDELVSLVDSCECLDLDVHLRCFDKTPAVPYEEKLHSEFISLCHKVAELTDKPE